MRVWRRVGLRARLTLIATGALAVGVAAGSILLLRGFATSRIHAIDVSSRAAADNIAGLVAAGATPPTLPVEAGQSAQVLSARGAVLAVSPGASRTLPLVTVGVAEQIARHGPRSRPVDQVAGTGVNRVLVDAVSTAAGTEYVVVAESLQDERATLHSLGRFVAAAAPLLLLVFAVTVWFLLGRALGAVTALGRGAEAITDPAVGARLPLPDSRDEIRDLAVSLNAMLERLDDAAARERQFVGDVAHELRSPLASIHTQLEVALRERDAQTRLEMLSGTLQDTQRLGGLVDDLLTLARMESGAPLSTDLVDLAQLAAAPANGDALVRGERRSLARAIDNLVANAHRHARSRVVVSVERSVSGAVEVRVDDDGPGIPPEDRQRIFERFLRLDDARARDDGGSGLGLAIVRATATAHGGTVRVEDSELGGARFVLSLPAAS